MKDVPNGTGNFRSVSNAHPDGPLTLKEDVENLTISVKFSMLKELANDAMLVTKSLPIEPVPDPPTVKSLISAVLNGIGLTKSVSDALKNGDSMLEEYVPLRMIFARPSITMQFVLNAIRDLLYKMVCVWSRKSL
jgi:hypothetical protein